MHNRFAGALKLPPINDDVESTWNALERSVKEAAEQQLGVTKPARAYIDKLTWLWTAEVEAAVHAKKIAYKKWKETREEANRTAYVEARRQAKKAVAERKEEYTMKLYDDLEQPGGHRLLFRLAKRRQRAKEDIERFFCIEDERGVLLTKPDEVTRRW